MTDQLFDSRLTEHRNPNTIDIDTAESAKIVELINAEDRKVPDAVLGQREEIARAIDLAVESFRAGGRLVYVGAGTSGRLGVLDATECPPTFGVEPDMVQSIIAGGYMALVRSLEGAEDRADDGVDAIDDANVGVNDCVIGIAASSTTAFVRAALERAAQLGARTGFICCTEPGAEMRELVDVTIVPLVGPEVIAGSTRMKAGTATKLVLNSISTGAMIRIGKVYTNLMVDLQAVSEKLVDRGQRIVMAAAGVGRDEASVAIAEAEGSVKTAVLIASGAIGNALARLYLAEAGGVLKHALEAAAAVKKADLRGENVFTPHPFTSPDPSCLRRTMDALRALPKHVSQILKENDEAHLSARPGAGRWSAKEIIEHLVVFDQAVDGRLRAMLQEQVPFIREWDENVENPKIAESGAVDMPKEMVLMRLADGRAKLAARVEAIAPSDFARTGRHERFGLISVYQLLRQLIWHDDHHLRAIRRTFTA